MKNFLIAVLFVFFCASMPIYAKVTLPKIFSDNMVLQRESAIALWGWAAPGEKIEVRFKKQTRQAVADASGKWALKLAPEKAGGPFELNVSGENTISIKNVLVGEVWLCSGQSNMEWPVAISMNAAQELAAADNPNIRHIKVSRAISSQPQSDIKEGEWKVSTPETAGGFTAVGYFFAKRMYAELKVPIGIINSTWGGTNIETWISREGFESHSEFREMIAGMPKMDIESLSALRVVKKTKQVEELQGKRITDFDGTAFRSVAFDDSGLPMLQVPRQWESQSLGQMDGVVWLRKTFTLSAADAKMPAALELAMIDDEDISYVNGTEIGKTSGWNTKRKYSIPAGVLKEGKNVIAVRVTDGGGGGGIYGDPGDVKLSAGDKTIPLGGDWKFQVESIKPSTSENEFPSLAYNAMIHPLIPYSMRGVLWYQGESNAGRAYQYRTAFPLLISDWRQKWGGVSFPFYFVQLATYATGGNSNTGDGWPELREAQTMTLKVPNTGMAVTTDIGDPKDVHPTNKQEVGRRLSAIALRNIFGRKMVDSGPMFRSMKTAGSKAIVTFENNGSGLMTTDAGGVVKGFEVAGADQVFYPATGTIKQNTVTVSSEKVAVPVAVRFGWIGDASACNLFNKEGFPAVPFRTDDWKTVTKNEKYKITDLNK